MDDNLLAKLHFLFLAGSDCGECAECRGVYFCGLPKVNMLKACKLIAQQLIENKYARTWEESPLKQPQCGIMEHHLISLPTGKTLNKGNWQLARVNTKHGNTPTSLPV